MPLSESSQLLTVEASKVVEWQGDDSLVSRTHGIIDLIGFNCLVTNA